MNMMFKRILSSVLCMIMIVLAIPLGELAGIDWNGILGFKAKAANIAVGQIIEFGSYPQSEVTDSYLKARLAEQHYESDGKIVYNGNVFYRMSSTFYYNEPIKWKVLSIDNQGILVTSLNVLDGCVFANNTNAVWENSYLRTWLNTTFFNRAFTNNEKGKIVYSHLQNGDDPSAGYDGGNDTVDRMFVLSYADILDSSFGFSDDNSRKSDITAFARKRGVERSASDWPYYGYWYYWLRTPSSSTHFRGFRTTYYKNYASYVTGIHKQEFHGVRPAMRINLNFEINDVKTNSQYNLKITDFETNNPISGAKVEFDGQSYTTLTDGTVTLSVGNNVDSSATVRISKDSYSSETRKLYELNLYSENIISLTEGFDFSEMLADVCFEGETIYGPTIRYKGKEFPIFSFEGGVKIPFKEIFKGCVSTKYDPKENTLKVIIGVDQEWAEYEYNSDIKWNEDYQIFKDFYKTINSVSDGKARKDYSKVKGFSRVADKLKKSKATLGIDAEMSYAGYAEFDYSSGDLVFKEGGFVAMADVSSEESVPFSNFAYVKFKLEGSFGGTLKLSKDSEGTLNVSSEILVSVEPRFGGGLYLVSKDILSLEVGIKGEISGSIEIPAESFEQALELYLSADVYVSGRFLIFENPDLFSTNFPKFQLCPNIGMELQSLSTQAISQDEFELVDRNYLNMLKTQALGDINEENVYPYGSPRFVRLNDGRTVALFIYDDGTKSDINRTTLYYSIYDNDNWSNLLPVCDSGFADFSAEVCTDGTNIYAVWQRASEVYENTYTADEVATKTELVYSVYNGSGWSEPVIIDTNGKYQLSYSIAQNNDEVTVAWAENSDNDYLFMSGTSTVYKKTFSNSKWSEETVVTSTEGIVSVDAGYVSGQSAVAYIVDTDGDLLTSGDNEVYVDGTAITADSADDYEIGYHNGAFRWIKDGVLYSYNGSVSSMGVNVENDYRIITNGTQTAVTYIATDGFKNEIMISYLLGDGKFSKPVALTDYGKHITFYDVILNDDGTTTVIADVENLSEEEGVYPYTTTDMVCETLGKSVDIAVENVYTDGYFTRGGTVYFKGTVANISTSPVDNYTVTVTDEFGNTLRSKIIWSDVFAGESEDFSLEYVVPDDFDKRKVTVSVSVSDDKDTSNNSFETEIGYSNLSVSSSLISRDGEITAVVINNGCDVAQNVVAEIVAFGTEDIVLTVVDCGDIEPGESYTVKYTVAEEYLDFATPYVVNKFKINVETESTEEFLGNNDVNVVYAPISVEGMAVSSNKITLDVGSTTQLIATVYPSEAYNQKIHWVSDSTDVVTVDENGNIQAVSGGTAIITAISDDGGYVASCEVTSVVKVSSISMTEEKATINVGQTKTLKYEIDPDTASDKSVIWNSSDISVATVSSTGIVTALKSGVTTVTVTSVDGKFSDSCDIIVINAVTGITISDVTASICLDNQKQLSAQVAPLDADNTSITWKSSDDYIVTVDETGLITGVGTGTATITATSVDGGYTATCEVTVGKHVSNVLLSEQTITIKPGLAHQLSATVLPLNATDKSVEWLSINENIAVVDENGVVTGVGLGTTSIVVSTIDGGYYAICEVVVTGYKVEYYSDGNLHFSEYLFEGEELTVPDIPVREGYTFEKWSPDVAETMSNENLVYEAVWNANVHNVSFIVEGETYNSYDCAYSDVIKTPDIPKIEGYTFVGWTPSIPETMPNNDISFTAVFELASYTATFIADGTVISTQTFTIETESLDEPPVPQKAGYYACWSGYIIEAKDITIVAKYYSPEVVVISKRTLDIGDTYRLLPSCNFEVTDKSWKSSDTSIATVNQHGKVTAVGEGECRVTVTCYGKDSLGNDVQASKSTKIIVNGKSETTNKKSFREMFDEFFEVTLHDLLYNLREFLIVLFRYAY